MEWIYNLLLHVDMNLAIGFLAVAGFIGSIITFFHKRGLNNGKVTKMPSLFGSRKKEEAPAEPAEGAAAPPKRSFWQRMRRGKQQNGMLAASFKQARSVLRGYFPGRRALYRLPWFLVIGESGSGKTSLLRHAGLKLPLGPPKADAAGREQPLDWWFYDQAVVLDLKGSLLQANAGETALWRRFTKMLYKSRRERALDGVVLTIRADVLRDADSTDLIQIQNSAARLYEQLIQLQQQTGMTFPVYVVVTHCDQLDGFQAFGAQLDSAQRDHMFGWSVPFEPHHQYASVWVDQAFQSMTRRLGQIQLETAYRGFHRHHESVAPFFLFPDALRSLRSGLRTYLDAVFTPTSFHDALMLRGIYFTGDPTPPPECDPGAVAVAEARRPAFVRDLLATRIFPERALARPTRHKLKTQSRQVMWLRGLVVCSALVLAFGSLHGFSQMLLYRNALLGSLRGMNHVLVEQQNGDFDHTWFAHKNNPLFLAMNRFQQQHFFSPFFPSSWFSSINGEIDHATTVAFEKILLDGLGRQLQQRAHQLTEAQTRRGVERDENSPLPHALSGLDSFRKLQHYTRDLSSLQTHLSDYNNLRKTLDLEVLRRLIRYCFDFDMPEAGLRRLAAMDIDFRRFGAVNFDRRFEASARARVLFDDLLDDLFYPVKRLVSDQEMLRQVMQHQNRWVEDRPTLINEMRAVAAGLKNSERLLQTEPFGLLREGEAQLGPDWPALLTLLRQNRLLEPNLDQRLEAAFRERLFAGRDQLDLPLLNEAVKYREPMRAFFGLPFMQVAAEGGETLLYRETFEDWKKADLFQALRYRRAYRDFRRQRLGGVGQGHWAALLDKLALECFEDAVNRLIERAPMLPMGEDQAFSEQDLTRTIRGFAAAARDLSELEHFFAETGLTRSRDALNHYLTETALALLFRADAFLPRDLYLDRDFGAWDGHTPMTAKALGFDDDKALQAWLDATRNHLFHIGLNGVAPLLAVLDAGVADPEVQSRELVLRWRAMLEEIDAYRRRQPYPALRRLEVYLKRDMRSLHLDNYRTELADIRPSSNYFLERINQVKLKLRHHLTALDQKRHEVRFPQRTRAFAQGVVDPFNTWLAGTFPFAGADAARETDPAVLTQIVAACERLAPPLVDSITFEADPDDDALAAHRFIKQFQGAYRFLQQFRSVEGRAPLQLRFRERAPHEDERFGNHIVAWRLRIGEKEVPFTREAAVAAWSADAPIELRLQWAKNAPHQPDSRVRSPWYRVEGREVVYSFEGRYALLRLLTRHVQHEPAFQKGETHLLRFEIPLHHDGDGPRHAVVFSRLRLSVAGREPLSSLPLFPRAAPRVAAQPPDDHLQTDPTEVHLGKLQPSHENR